MVKSLYYMSSKRLYKDSYLTKLLKMQLYLTYTKKSKIKAQTCTTVLTNIITLQLSFLERDVEQTHLLLLKHGFSPILFGFSSVSYLHTAKVRWSYLQLQWKAEQEQEQNLVVYKICNTLLQKLSSIHKSVHGKYL